MSTLQNRLDYLDNKIKEHEQLIEEYKYSTPYKDAVLHHTNLIKYYKQRKALITREAT